MRNLIIFFGESKKPITIHWTVENQHKNLSIKAASNSQFSILLDCLKLSKPLQSVLRS
jgi:hypothetical protein